MASGQAKLPLYLQALPSLSLAPEFHLLSDQWQQYILIGVGTLLRTVHEKDLGCRLLMRIIPKPSPQLTLVHGKFVFHKTGTWCQKGWGLLI